MDYRIGNYLTRASTRGSTYGLTFDKTFCLCIAETRASYWLPRVIENAIQTFPGWKVYVIAPLHVLQWIAPQFPEEILVPVVMHHVIHSRDMFNTLMYSPSFWETFEEEYVLMFQCDVVFSPDAASHPIFKGLPKYPLYGAVCGTLKESDFVINGGLSLRHVQSFKNACGPVGHTALHDNPHKLDEDSLFTKHFRASHRVPSMKECLDFAIESVGNPATAIGIHGTDKGYCPPVLITSLLGLRPSLPVIDCVMYNGEPILETRLKILGRFIDACIVVESTVSHSGQPKELEFPKKFPEGHPLRDKVVYKVIDTYPPMPPDFGQDYPWVYDESRDAWWKEQYQRDYAKQFIGQIATKESLVIVSDVDEIPDPDALNRVCAQPELLEKGPIHLHMAFLLYSPQWHNPREIWTRPYICHTSVLPESLTAERCRKPDAVIHHAGWHCSSFLNVDDLVRKCQHFAHREHHQTDPDIIRERIQHGRDPYGREGMDAEFTQHYMFLSYV